MTEKIYYSLANENARTGKVVVNYIYDDENGVDFTYKAVSTDPILSDLFVFFATDGPSASMKSQAERLPALVGMLPIDEENPSPRIFNFQGLNAVSGNYKGVVATLLQMFPDKFAEWQ